MIFVSLDNTNPYDSYKTSWRLEQKFAAHAMYLFPFHTTEDWVLVPSSSTGTWRVSWHKWFTWRESRVDDLDRISTILWSLGKTISFSIALTDSGSSSINNFKMPNLLSSKASSSYSLSSLQCWQKVLRERFPLLSFCLVNSGQLLTNSRISSTF